jgi:hypothetical protein
MTQPLTTNHPKWSQVGVEVEYSIREQLLRSNERQFRGGLVCKARRLVVSLNSRPRVIKKKRRGLSNPPPQDQRPGLCPGRTYQGGISRFSHTPPPLAPYRGCVCLLIRETGNSLPNNQRQCRTCYTLCHILYPVSAAHTSIFRMDSNSTCYRQLIKPRPPPRNFGRLSGR